MAPATAASVQIELVILTVQLGFLHKLGAHKFDAALHGQIDDTTNQLKQPDDCKADKNKKQKQFDLRESELAELSRHHCYNIRVHFVLLEK